MSNMLLGVAFPIKLLELRGLITTWHADFINPMTIWFCIHHRWLWRSTILSSDGVNNHILELVESRRASFAVMRSNSSCLSWALKEFKLFGSLSSRETKVSISSMIGFRESNRFMSAAIYLSLFSKDFVNWSMVIFICFTWPSVLVISIIITCTGISDSDIRI